jgi:5,10-methylene-tetrahydrofolate dehydrogenase/methenyl tetrahydrofolate cyclohydrolase
MAIVSLISVMGMITNPVVIARTILEGSYLEQALRQQTITVFMITTSNVLSCVVATHLVLWVCVDSEHHIRADCIDMRPHVLLRTYSNAIDAVISFLRGDVRVYSGGYPEPPSERTPLRN